MSPEIYRAAVIGCGRIGCAFDDDPRRGYVSTHAGAYTQTPGVELVALVDVDRERLDKYGDKFKVPGRYTDAAEMLQHERPDIVSICTWPETHRSLAELAVQSGAKAVFCEKPIADTLENADAMIAACRDAGVLLVIDHQRRFDRFHRAVAEYVRSGKLGRIQLATSYYIAGIANTGTHLLDLLRFMFGDAEWVQAVSSRNVSPNPADPNLDAWVQFRDGPLAVLQACDVKDFAIFETTVIGSAGRLRIARHGSDLVYEEARPSHRFAEYKELYPALPPVDPGDETREYMLQALAHLLECLREKRPPLSSGEDGRATLELIQALRESADCGGRRVEIR